MKLTADILKLHDPERVCHQIEAFIRDKTNELQRSGVAFGLSGGLDSTVAAYLCARSVGPEKVLALYLPDKDSEKRSGEDARKVAAELGIQFKVIDITDVLEKLGIYKLIPTRLLGSRKMAGWVFRNYFNFTAAIGRNQFEEALLGTSNLFLARGEVYAKTKHRIRMVVLYQQAGLKNLLVVGAANRTEHLIGFFSKWGIDHATDVMPLQPLYKSQVRELAVHLGAPPEIINKPPIPDLIPGFKDEDVVSSYQLVDLVLVGLQGGLSSEEISTQLNMPLKRVEQILRWTLKSAHMRNSPYVPDLIR